VGSSSMTMVEGRRAPELSVTDGFLAKKSLRLVMYEVESKLNNQQGDNVKRRNSKFVVRIWRYTGT